MKNIIMFNPQKDAVEITTDDVKMLDALIGSLEARIIETVKKGSFEEGRDLINFYLELEKAKDIFERGSVSGDCKFTF